MKTFSIVGLVLTCFLAEKGQGAIQAPPAPILAPTLAYTCLMDGTVTLDTTNLTGRFQAFAVGPYSSLGNNKKCFAPITFINASNPTFVLKNCNATKPITVYLMNDIANKEKIIGGRSIHEYSITCTLPPNGIAATVSSKFNVSDILAPTTETEYLKPSPLKMSITPESAPIGETLTISIIEEYSEKFYILPNKCNAKSGSNDIDQSVVLLQSGKTKDTEVLTDFDVETKGEANATLYAFRFIDSETVNFECTVTFCGNKNCVNGAYDATPAPTGKRRRRAAVEIGHGEKYQVSASFRVVDPEEVQPTSSQSVVRFHPTLTTFLVFLGTVAARRFNRECLF